MEAPDPKTEQIKLIILDAAETRFRAFGYTKTTLAEIAESAAMSAANMYRFYENKLDIAAAVARRLLDQREAALAQDLDHSALPCAERLQRYLLAGLRFDRTLAKESAPLAALLEKVQEERKDLAVAHRKTKQAMLATLVEAGIAKEEFAPGEAQQIAQTIRAATVLFDTPQLNRHYPSNELERLAQSVVVLILDGLRSA